MDTRHWWIAQKIQDTFRLTTDLVEDADTAWLEQFLCEEKNLEIVNDFLSSSGRTRIFFVGIRSRDIAAIKSTLHLYESLKPVDPLSCESETILYLLKRNSSIEIDASRITKELICGEIQRNAVETLSIFLSEICLPIFGTQKEWGQSTFENHQSFLTSLDKVVANLQDPTLMGQQRYRRAILHIPTHLFTEDGKLNLHGGGVTPELVKEYETVVLSWIGTIEGLLQDFSDERHLDNREGPMGELELWRSRQMTLNVLGSQLKSKECKNIIGALISAKSRVLKRWKVVDSGITEAMNETKDKIKYLESLEKYFLSLHQSDNPKEIAEVMLPGVVATIKQYDAISRYFARQGYLGLVFGKISNQMVVVCKRHIQSHFNISDDNESCPFAAHLDKEIYEKDLLTDKELQFTVMAIQLSEKLQQSKLQKDDSSLLDRLKNCLLLFNKYRDLIRGLRDAMGTVNTMSRTSSINSLSTTSKKPSVIGSVISPSRKKKFSLSADANDNVNSVMMADEEAILGHFEAFCRRIKQFSDVITTLSQFTRLAQVSAGLPRPNLDELDAEDEPLEEKEPAQLQQTEEVKVPAVSFTYEGMDPIREENENDETGVFVEEEEVDVPVGSPSPKGIGNGTIKEFIEKETDYFSAERRQLSPLEIKVLRQYHDNGEDQSVCDITRQHLRELKSIIAKADDIKLVLDVETRDQGLFEETYTKFLECAQRCEQYLNAYLSAVLMNKTNTMDSLTLLTKFSVVQNRQGVRPAYNQNFIDIFHNFERDLIEVQKEYEANKSMANSPSVAFEDNEVFEDLPAENDEFDDDHQHEALRSAEFPRKHTFTRLFERHPAYNSNTRVCFIENCPVQVRITSFDNSFSTKLHHPTLYTIEVKHGDFEWTIKRRYKHFRQLHEALILFRAGLGIPVPSRRHLERRRDFREQNQKLPRFPTVPETFIPAEKLPRRMAQLEAYLQGVMRHCFYKNHPETLKFLEVSHLSFIGDLGSKCKEGLVRKHSGGYKASFFCCGYWPSSLRWNKRWLLIKDSFIACVNPSNSEIRTVMLIDHGFQIHSDEGWSRSSLRIENMTRNLLIDCWSQKFRVEWESAITSVLTTTGRDFLVKPRFNSYAPVRHNTRALWLVDGSDYFAAVANALDAAEEEIYISDWFLSPEIYMKRPITDENKWRLDDILRRKAEQGVKIFVLLYKEIKNTLGIYSWHAKRTLSRLHPTNIKVLRHPDHNPGGTLFWGRHEKIVVVDQRVAFTGGLDLCFGRWDNFTHRLTDVGSILKSPSLANFNFSNGSIPSLAASPPLMFSSDETKRGVGTHAILNHVDRPSKRPPFAYERQLTTEDLFNPYEDGNITDEKTDFISEEDQEMGSSVSSPQTTSGRLLATVHRVKAKIKNLSHGSAGRRCSPSDIFLKNQLDTNDDAWTTSMCEVTLDNMGLAGSTKLWIGKDYCHIIYKDIQDASHPFTDFIDRNTTPRLPWHDVGACVVGPAARDIARHFIQTWNFVKTEKAKDSSEFPLLLPKSYENLTSTLPSYLTKSCEVTCQVLRSAGDWSAGIVPADTSIHEAYIEAIAQAKHYIYIENQYFISVHDDSQVMNRVSEAIFDRIKRAHLANEVFRLYVVMPLLPGLEGEYGTSRGVIIQALSHWNYRSISRGGNSLLERIKKEIGDPMEYVCFCGLRTWSELNANLVTEPVYLHSKLMIVDDRIAIIGSANINDRSLVGKRDSELCVYIEDTEMLEGTMNGEKVLVGKYASSLRKRLFCEHLGKPAPSQEIEDPVCDEFFKGIWQTQARSNTVIYEKVFNCNPSNEVHNFSQLHERARRKTLAKEDPSQAVKTLVDIRGYLVLIPIHFLRDENLLPRLGDKEVLLPGTLWS